MRGLTLRDRRNAVLTMMARAGLERLVCAGTGHHMIDLDNPVAHLTGYRSIGPALLIVEGDGRSRLIASAGEADAIADLDLADACSVDDVGAAFRTLVGARRATGAVGLASLQRRVAGAVISVIGEDAPSLDDQFRAATAAKTEHELQLARRATEIAEHGFTKLLEIVRPGMRECDLAIELNLYMRELGANDSFLMLNCGPRQDAVMPSSERRIELGDLLLCELSPSVAGQFTQICRTVGVGGEQSQTAVAYQHLVNAMHAGIERVAPGARLGDVCRAIDDHLSEQGYAQYSRPPFIRRRGHGLGCGSTAPGDVSVDNDTILEAGMLFMVHPNQFLPETGYMMCGEPVLVTETGHEVLTRSRSAFMEVPA